MDTDLLCLDFCRLNLREFVKVPGRRSSARRSVSVGLFCLYTRSLLPI